VGFRQTQAHRLINLQAAAEGELFYRAWRAPQAAPRRPIGLRQNQRDVMTGIEQAR
jgi:hypothetical protein